MTVSAGEAPMEKWMARWMESISIQKMALNLRSHPEIIANCWSRPKHLYCPHNDTFTRNESREREKYKDILL